jgi:hypothetical protein
MNFTVSLHKKEWLTDPSIWTILCCCTPRSDLVILICELYNVTMEREVIYWSLDVHKNGIARLAILYSLHISSVRESKLLLLYYCYMLLSVESGLPLCAFITFHRGSNISEVTTDKGVYSNETTAATRYWFQRTGDKNTLPRVPPPVNPRRQMSFFVYNEWALSIHRKGAVTLLEIN